MAQTSGTDIGCLDEPCREEDALPRAQALQAWGFLFSPTLPIRFLIQPLSYEGDASPPLKAPSAWRSGEKAMGVQ